MAAGELADGTSSEEEVLPHVLDLVVPGIAPECLVHQFRDGRLECIAARGAEPVPEPRARPEAHAALDGGDDVVAPLRVRGRTTGWISFRGGGFEARDLPYLQVLANRLAVALDNARLVLAERQLEALVAGMEDAVTVRDGNGRILLGNDAAVRLLGASSQEDLLGTSLVDLWARYALYAPDGRPIGDDGLSWMRALQAERPGPMLMRRVDLTTGEQQWLQSKATVLNGGDGRPALVMNVTEDVTASTRAQIARRLMVEAGRLLSETTDVAATLEEVAALVVPELADWCSIDLPGPARLPPPRRGGAHRPGEGRGRPQAARRAPGARRRRRHALARHPDRRRGAGDGRRADDRREHRRRRAPPRARGAGPRCAAGGSAALGRRRARRAHAGRLPAAPALRRARRGAGGGAGAARRRRAAQRAAAARPRGDRARALRRPAARPGAAAAGVRGRGRVPPGGRGHRGGRRLLRGGRRARGRRSWSSATSSARARRPRR